MGYKADFRNASERKLVNMAWELSGLSQGAFTRVVLLREALRLAELAQVKGTDTEVPPPVNDDSSKQGTLERSERGQSAEATADNTVSGEAASESISGTVVADAPAANNTP